MNDFLVNFNTELKDKGDSWIDAYDHDGRPKRLSIQVEVDSVGAMWIRPEGYSENSASDDTGFPIGLELYNGRLRILAWTDINEADPQIIDMEGARVEKRCFE
tara:strand:+ start:434 stop:742 length:309 start_codon:yes stop_codon:yes gene_type:complete